MSQIFSELNIWQIYQLPSLWIFCLMREFMDGARGMYNKECSWTCHARLALTQMHNLCRIQYYRQMHWKRGWWVGRLIDSSIVTVRVYHCLQQAMRPPVPLTLHMIYYSPWDGGTECSYAISAHVVLQPDNHELTSRIIAS